MIGYQGLQIGAGLQDIVRFCNQLLLGKLNAVTAVTLSAGTSTTILDSRIGAQSFLGLSPTAAASAALVAGLFVASKGKGAATLTHATAVGTETFDVLIIG